MTERIDIVPATPHMLRAFYAQGLGRTVQAIAAVQGDDVLGIAGTYLEPVGVVAFVRFTEDLKRHPKVIVRGGRMLLQMFAKRQAPVLAICDRSIESAERFLTHWGFRHINGDVYTWTH